MAASSGSGSRRARATSLDLIRRSASIAPGLTAATAALVVLSALLWPALSVATGTLAGAVPEAVGHGLRSAPGQRVQLALFAATAVYVLIQIVGPLRAAVGNVLMRRVDEAIATGLMRSVSGPRSIAHLEDPLILDPLAQAQGIVTGTSTGASVTYLAGTWATRLQGIAALLIVARFRWWLAPVLAAGEAASYAWRRRHWVDVTRVVFDRTENLRRSDYFRRLALRPDAAKETRVFALDGWLVTQYRDSYLATMRRIWQERKTGASAALVVSGLLFLLEAGALILIGRAGARGTISLAAAVVYAQSVLATGALGRFDMDTLQMEDGLSSFGRV